ncbi:ribonuclease H2, large subunit [Anaeromyces robustus]|uniref:Ribonuclease n=1 Tax=Anaeromyces robustus TaxID=1754192 RepID=A0A1Y1XPW6_9FUNG|nr:ribonuclease H2, large subunit [Anaeromyces robustus]|eukprot:ORX87799.1 ribonuclease H2, large subunit [Anaeromyces robustus]
MEFKSPMYFTETIHSPIPEICKEEEVLIGIDEAGRGPVFGPMVYATCFCPLSKVETLNSLGFADSKTLTEQSRNALFEIINNNSDIFGWMATACSPQDISRHMLRKEKYNLNQFAHDTTIDLINNVLKLKVKVKEVYIDAVGPAESYQAKLKSFFPTLNIVVNYKADSKYPIVSAASICAKVNRDFLIKNWEFVENKSFSGEKGSGYPGDPKTKNWIKNHCDKVFGFPGLVRFSWSTCENYLLENGYSVYWYVFIK